MNGRMLVSRKRNRYASIDCQKVKNGRFLTRRDIWLTPQVQAFILSADPEIICDPFAGGCHMLRAASRLLPNAPTRAYDILSRRTVEQNDSLLSIPCCGNMLIVTNPPFLAKHSARRKRVYDNVAKYFEHNTEYTDLYQIALARMLAVATHVVAIVPEIFINAQIFRSRLHEITVLEQNPFTDTDCPVAIACFGPPPNHPAVVYKDTDRLGDLDVLEAVRLHPTHRHSIRFNVKDGPIGFQAVDTHDPSKPIRFVPRAKLNYSTSGIKISSRLVTYIDVPCLEPMQIETVCTKANGALDELRAKSHDIILSPFKGNRRDGHRRRRLDYRTARAILEDAIDQVLGPATLWTNS